MPARRSLLALAAFAAVTLLVTVALVPSDEAGTAPTAHRAFERETGTSPRVGQATDDAALAAVDGPGDADLAERHPRREASILDGLELISLDALLLAEGSDTPLAHRRVAVYDANDVRISATTDERGRVRVDDLLVAGDVDLYVEGEARRSRGASFAFPQKSSVRPTTESGKHVVRHGDADAGPDVWRVRIPARFAVVVPPLGDGNGVPSCYGRAKGDDAFVKLQQVHVTRSRGVHAKVVRSPKAAQVESGPWSLGEVHGRDDDRLLHVVQVRSDAVYAGTIELPVVPTETRPPLVVRLNPTRPGERGRLEAIYGKHLAKHIDLLQRRLPGADEPTPAAPRADASITGTVTTSSGRSIDGLRIRAVPTTQSARLGRFRPGDAAVEWSANGVGHFEITGLDETRYYLRLSAPSKPLLRPERLSVAAPSTGVRLEAIDDFERITVGVRAREPGGGWLDGFTADLRADYRGGTIEAGATALPLPHDGGAPETTIVHRALPHDAEYTVTITRDGYEPCVVSKSDFGSEGDVWTATVTLCPVPPTPEEEVDGGG